MLNGVRAMPLQPVQHQAHHQPAHAPRKDKLTAASVFLSLLLAIFLIALAERAVYDVNRIFNPLYGQCNPSRYLIISDSVCQVEKFAMQTVLFHSYVTFPVFLLFLVLALIFKRNHKQTWQSALYRVSAVVALVFGLQLLLECTFYLFHYHRLIAWYFVFGMGVITTIWLVVYLERQQEKKRQLKRHGGPEAGHDDDDEH